MATRAGAYAAQLEEANQEVITTVERCSEAQWRANGSSDPRPVCVLAHHIAGGHGAITGFVQAVANGQPVPSLTPEMLDAGNAQHARQFANVGRAETLGLLKSGSASAAAAVRALSDEQLDRTGQVFGHTMRTQDVIERILIGHVNEHLASIKAALG